VPRPAHQQIGVKKLGAITLCHWRARLQRVEHRRDLLGGQRVNAPQDRIGRDLSALTVTKFTGPSSRRRRAE
jgi:hypothetical protein